MTRATILIPLAAVIGWFFGQEACNAPLNEVAGVYFGCVFFVVGLMVLDVIVPVIVGKPKAK